MCASHSFITGFANHTICIDASDGSVLYVGTLLKNLLSVRACVYVCMCARARVCACVCVVWCVVLCVYVRVFFNINFHVEFPKVSLLPSYRATRG